MSAAAAAAASTDLTDVSLIIKNPSPAVADFHLVVPASTSVRILKQQLSSTYPGSPDPVNQKLIYAGKLLKDEQLLSDVVMVCSDPQSLHIVVRKSASHKSPAATPATSPSGPTSSPSPATAASSGAVSPQQLQQQQNLLQLLEQQRQIEAAIRQAAAGAAGVDGAAGTAAAGGPGADIQPLLDYARQHGHFPNVRFDEQGQPIITPPPRTPPRVAQNHLAQAAGVDAGPADPAAGAAAAAPGAGGAGAGPGAPAAAGMQWGLLVKLTFMVYIFSGGGPYRTYFMIAMAVIIYLMQTGRLRARFQIAAGAGANAVRNAAAAAGAAAPAAGAAAADAGAEAEAEEPPALGFFGEIVHFFMSMFLSLLPMWRPPPRRRRVRPAAAAAGAGPADAAAPQPPAVRAPDGIVPAQPDNGPVPDPPFNQADL